MTIKKQYQDLIAFLQENEGKKVNTVLPQIIAMCEAKVTTKTFQTDEDGNVTHIFCYYHKEWEALSEVEYGPKKSSTHGFNTMCKIGANQWSKQQREAKRAREELLARVAVGELDASMIQDELDRIEEERKAIMPL